MSDAAAVAPAKSPAKKRASTGRPKAAAKVASHPTYAAMVKSAISNLKEKGGSSKSAILKYILSNYKVGDNIKSINAHLRMAINRGVKSGNLKQVKGHGASGSFRLGEKAAKVRKPAAPKVKKPSVPKKKAAPKKKASPKKAAAAAKPKKAKSPKKPKSSPKKKPASPKKPKAAKSPKKSAVKKPKSPKKAAKKTSPKKK